MEGISNNVQERKPPANPGFSENTKADRGGFGEAYAWGKLLSASREHHTVRLFSFLQSIEPEASGAVQVGGWEADAVGALVRSRRFAGREGQERRREGHVAGTSVPWGLMGGVERARCGALPGHHRPPVVVPGRAAGLGFAGGSCEVLGACGVGPPERPPLGQESKKRLQGWRCLSRL